MWDAVEHEFVTAENNTQESLTESICMTLVVDIAIPSNHTMKKLVVIDLCRLSLTKMA